MSVAAPIEVTEHPALAILESANNVHDIPITQVQPAPDNPRRQVGDVSELAETIASVGILEPLIVTPRGVDAFVVVAGHRRLAAAQEANLATVPCLVRSYSDAERLEAMVIENLQREDLSPIEEGQAFKQLLVEDVSQRDLAARVGRSQAYISKRLALVDLPHVAQDAVYSGGITLEDAQDLLKLRSKKKIESVVKAATKKPGKDAAAGAPETINPHELEWRLRQALATQARADSAAKTRKKLKADGVKVVKRPEYGDKKVVSLGRSYGELGIAVKDHEDEPCHVGYVDYNGSASYACTDVGRHKRRGGASKVKGTIVGHARGPRGTREQSEQQKARQQRAAACNASEKARQAHYATLVKRRVDRDDVVFLTSLVVLLEVGYGSGTENLARLLGLKVPARRSWKGPHPALKVMSEFAAKRKENRARLALAQVLLTLEAGIGSYRYGGDDTWVHMKPFFDWLKKSGYELLPIEKELVYSEKPKEPPTAKKTTAKSAARPKKKTTVHRRSSARRRRVR